MDIFKTDTPTLEECLALWKKKDWLRADVAELELKCRELQNRVNQLSEIERNLRKSTTQLCYDLGILCNQLGRLIDTNKTNLWTKSQADIDIS